MRAVAPQFRNPYTWLVFPEEVNRTRWFTSPELISLDPTPLWEGLSDEQRRVLRFWDAVNFYSLNIHGEKTLIEGVARVLYRRDLLDASDYLHHILDEESKHRLYFGTFCRRDAGKIYPDTSSFTRESLARPSSNAVRVAQFALRCAVRESSCVREAITTKRESARSSRARAAICRMTCGRRTWSSRR